LVAESLVYVAATVLNAVLFLLVFVKKLVVTKYTKKRVFVKLGIQAIAQISDFEGNCLCF
jgi:hypothetical protein